LSFFRWTAKTGFEAAAAARAATPPQRRSGRWPQPALPAAQLSSARAGTGSKDNYITSPGFT